MMIVSKKFKEEFDDLKFLFLDFYNAMECTRNRDDFETINTFLFNPQCPAQSYSNQIIFVKMWTGEIELEVGDPLYYIKVSENRWNFIDIRKNRWNFINMRKDGSLGLGTNTETRESKTKFTLEEIKKHPILKHLERCAVLVSEEDKEGK